MPHVHEVFLDDLQIRNFLRVHKTLIRKSIANILGYPEKEVALIPNCIPEEDAELSDNLLPLEFVIDSGTHALDCEDECAKKIRDHIIERCPRAKEIDFGVWVISHAKNGFAEHQSKVQPANPQKAFRQLQRRFGSEFKDRRED